MTVARVPLNIFGVGFGLAGLATTWRIAVTLDLAPAWIGVLLVIVAAVTWAVSLVLYSRYVVTNHGALAHDLHDMTVGPFACELSPSMRAAMASVKCRVPLISMRLSYRFEAHPAFPLWRGGP